MKILWLDDMRNPYQYLSSNKNTNTFIRNKSFYDNLMKSTDVDFVWVKNFDEFKNFIMSNGIPEFVSFDHDLGKGLPKGLDCAKWLVKYCEKNNINLPKFYVHSANPNGQREINALLNGFSRKPIAIKESKLYEIIYEAVRIVLSTL